MFDLDRINQFCDFAFGVICFLSPFLGFIAVAMELRNL